MCKRMRKHTYTHKHNSKKKRDKRTLSGCWEHTCSQRCPTHHVQDLPKQEHKRQHYCRNEERKVHNFLPF